MSSRNRDIRYYTQEGLAETIYAAIADGRYPQYGYGVVQAAALAGSLGYPRMSVLELGVAGGNGLLELERLSKEHSGASGVDIQVAGFDSGGGMPEPIDHRDLPYIWQAKFFRMDEAALRKRLSIAALHLGDVADTGKKYITNKPAPIGFISFDFDYYSSTVRAFEALLQGDFECYLPRVVCYFDDTVGPHHVMHSCFTGELLAISEFNSGNERRKLGKLNGLRHKIRPLDGEWVEGIYILHLFDHPRYNEYMFHTDDRQLPLGHLSHFMRRYLGNFKRGIRKKARLLRRRLAG
jgi:hypothetical protein